MNLPQTNHFESLIFIIGLSGAGKSTASRAFSDNGYYAIDNLPVSLLSHFLEESASNEARFNKTSILIDIHTHTQAEELLKHIQQISQSTQHTFQLIFLDSDTDTIIKRYSETRRPHPLFNSSSDITLHSAIQRERDLLIHLKEHANIAINSSKLTPHDLRRSISNFSSEIKSNTSNIKKELLRVNFQSFGFKNGVPTDCDLIADVRFLPNPYFNDSLRAKTGLDSEVREFVLRSKEAQIFIEKYNGLLAFLLPRYVYEGKAYLTIGIGCTGGQHRSVAISSELVKLISTEEYSVGLIHRDIPDKQNDT